MINVMNGIIREKMKVTQKFLERIKNNFPPWYSQVLRLQDRWPNRKLSWSPEGRNRRGSPKMK